MITKLCKMTPEEYHSDPMPQPSLSSSIAHELLERSPLHAYTRHPRLGGVARRATKEMNSGTLAHALLLGAGLERIEVVDAKDFKTKAAQEIRDAAIDAGKTPVILRVYEEAQDVAKTLKQRFADFGIALTGQSEMAAFWVETTDDGFEIQCRGQQDHIMLPTVYDLKSIRCAHPKVCQRHVDSYDYCVQRAAYVSAIEKIHPELAGRVDFQFVFFELEPPFAVTPVRLSGEFRELGERRWRRAVNAWGECIKTGKWPSYVDGVIDLAPNPHALNRDMESQMAETAGTYMTDIPWEAA